MVLSFRQPTAQGVLEMDAACGWTTAKQLFWQRNGLGLRTVLGSRPRNAVTRGDDSASSADLPKGSYAPI